MKKKLKYIVFILFAILLFIYNKTYASSGSTVFIGEPIVLDSYKDIEITQNTVEIDEETSEIKNVQLFTNLSDKTITKKASIKLEDSYSNLTINELRILVNGLEIKEITKLEDNYIFYFQILPNEGKRIEINYKTNSNLQDAKIIKYTMDAIKGKEVKLFQINVKLSKYDVPLVQKIWPGAYEFDDVNNIVSTEYFNFTVNNLTSSFILQKETYKNLKYGDYTETYSDEDRYIINNAKKLIDNGLNITINQDDYYENIVKKITSSTKEFYNISIMGSLQSIIDYVVGLQLQKKNQVYYIGDNGKKYSNIELHTVGSKEYCLTNQILRKIDKDYILRIGYEEDEYSLYGKKIAIDYYETKQDKILYVYKDLKNSHHSSEGDFEYVIRPEYDILRTDIDRSEGKRLELGYKEVFVNSDIDGNKIDVTEKEIIDFVNMMNIDLYFRIIISDNKSDNSFVSVLYYTENSKEIALNYLHIEGYIASCKKSLNNIEASYNNEDYVPIGEDKEEWYQREKKRFQEMIKELNNSYEKKDDIIMNDVRVPALAHSIAHYEYKDEKYVVEL